ncbi:LysR substrate-binding domain-containing protein [Nocardia sp. alder85J]|uniref:LysR substrate-binding domain-containing protein n=1 Tax=Nocardia sp. alder85J TaxID=2862949 RepID=UPI001CD6CDD4|nr:LysR substrate-binding domain-containing protein [Nocardia sp. alder85J]MCX4096766.1 LysR substrate-binding domain-containing protein [Nocardia sp. alder85J]
MEVAQLEAFRTVAEELHFGRAAARIHVAQPYLSRQIRALEADLGAPLFDRTTRRVELTPAGQALADAVGELLDLDAAVRAAVLAAHRGEHGRIRCSFAGPSSQGMIGRLARAVRERHEHIDLVFRAGRYGTSVVQDLLGGTTDLVIARLDHPYTGIANRPIGHERGVLAVPSDHPLAGAGAVAFADLREEAFVTLPESVGSIVRDQFVALCRRNGFVPNIVQAAPDSWTAMALVAAGVGLHYTTDAASENVSLDGVRIVPIADEPEPIFVHLAWRADDRSPLLARVLEISEDTLPTCDRPSRG